MTGSCTEVSERKYLICIEIWQVELESCVWRVSFHKYAYVHGDPIQGIDPTGMFLGVLVSIGIGLGNFSQELASGGLVISILETAGQAGFQGRALGLELIAKGEFDRGFELYNAASRLLGTTFEMIDNAESAVSFLSFGALLGVGIYSAAKNIDELPGIVQSMIQFGKRSIGRFTGSGLKGAEGAAKVLAQRASDIVQGLPGRQSQKTVAVVEVQNVSTGERKTLVALNGTQTVPGNRLQNGEIAVAGAGKSKEGWHAEANVLDYIRDLNDRRKSSYNGDWVILQGGVSRDVCSKQCLPMLEAQGYLEIVGNKFWNAGM
jgi:hypothetical protein